MHPSREFCWAGWLLLGAMIAPATVFAAEDDEGIASAVDGQDQDSLDERFTLPADFLDQLIFQTRGDMLRVRSQLQSQLRLQLGDAGLHYRLTAAQQEKLLLAAAIDTRHFFDDVERLRQHLKGVGVDQVTAFQAISKQAFALRRKLATGLYGEESFFAKTLSRMIDNEDDTELHDDADHAVKVPEEVRRHYRVSIEIHLLTLCDDLGLSDDQHAALVNMVLNQTWPPRLSGEVYHSAQVYASLAKIPPERMTLLLGEESYQRLVQWLAVKRNAKQFPIQQDVGKN